MDQQPLATAKAEPVPQAASSEVSVAPAYSAYSVLHLGHRVPGTLVAPGLSLIPEKTLGYVRSNTRARLASSTGTSHPADAQLPWRDYPIEALTDSYSLVSPPYRQHQIILGARNSLNEWGYQIRVDGHWRRRFDDPEIDGDWPVIQLRSQGLSLQPLAEADEIADLVTGIPLVISGEPCPRDFLVASCSDVAHVFDVDPLGRRGSSAEAWQALSELWQELKNAGLNDRQLAARMEEMASRLGVSESRHLLHAILAQRHDGFLLSFAITGSLVSIAEDLAHRWQVSQAVLLENGGSVGWQALVRGNTAPALLVSGPNHRPHGIAFLVLRFAHFVHPRSHDLLATGERTSL